MPQTTADRARRWPGGDSQAMLYLQAKGFKITKGWLWLAPTSDYNISIFEADAIIYLIEEWDFGGAIMEVGGKEVSLPWVAN